MSKSSNDLTYSSIQVNNFNQNVNRKGSIGYPEAPMRFSSPMYSAEQPRTPSIAQPQPFKMMTIEDNCVFKPQSKSCTMEVTASYNESGTNFWTVWSNATSVAKSSANMNFSYDVFIMPAQPLVESLDAQFMITIMYKIANFEINEMWCQINLAEKGTVIGTNTLVFQNSTDKATISYNYMGHFKSENVYRLQDFRITLFTKTKVVRPPTNRPFSMSVNPYPQNMLLAGVKVCKL